MYKVEKTFDVLNGTVPDFVYKEDILNGAYPVLKSKTGEKLIPVIIGDDGKVKKADIKDEWYSYKKQQWANAVLLVDGVDEPKNDEEIPEEHIESYFVWIPKYSYKLFDMGNYETAIGIQDKSQQAVVIQFGLEDTIDDNTKEDYKQCKTPMNEERTQGVSGASGDCQEGDWMTHPAFISFNVKGFWVGKFETSDAGSQKVQIKPNKSAWRSTTIGNSFTKSREYKKELVSHMIKNTEWGAVAYLTQSIYGRCKTENGATTCTEVAQNKNANYTTGMKDASTAYPGSKEASTTGNNSGIFDMNGGAWEQMASVMKTNENNDTPLWSSSGLNGTTLTDKKYYDVYKYNADMTHWNRRILGDATGELGPFQASGSDYISSYFGDYAHFVNSAVPWFYRGGNYNHGAAAGVFAFARNTGGAFEYLGFRVVLAP